MALYLDHTIVPAHDKVASARFIARIFGLEYTGLWHNFAPVKVNDTLSLDFSNRETFDHQHFAFLASDEEFDAILGRVKEEGVAFRSEHDSPDDGQINHNHQGRGFYFRDANDHSWEVITHTYI